MKKIIKENKWFPLFGFWAITIWPYIYVNIKYGSLSKKALNHELIHLKQQANLFVIPFFLIYLIEWLIKLIVIFFIEFRFDTFQAYKSISFELEAYEKDDDPNALEKITTFSFLNYLFKIWQYAT